MVYWLHQVTDLIEPGWNAFCQGILQVFFHLKGAEIPGGDFRIDYNRLKQEDWGR